MLTPCYLGVTCMPLPEWPGTIITVPRWQSSWGQHRAPLGPVGPRWDPYRPHEQISYIYAEITNFTGLNIYAINIGTFLEATTILHIKIIKNARHAVVSGGLPFIKPWHDHFCWNTLSYSDLGTRLHCPHSRLPRESHMSEQLLFFPVAYQWLCNQMQSAWDVVAVKQLTF